MNKLLLVIIIVVFIALVIIDKKLDVMASRQLTYSQYLAVDREHFQGQIVKLQKQLKDAQGSVDLEEKFQKDRCVCSMWQTSSDEPSLTRQQICSDTSTSTTKP